MFILTWVTWHHKDIVLSIFIWEKQLFPLFQQELNVTSNKTFVIIKIAFQLTLKLSYALISCNLLHFMGIIGYCTFWSGEFSREILAHILQFIADFFIGKKNKKQKQQQGIQAFCIVLSCLGEWVKYTRSVKVCAEKRFPETPMIRFLISDGDVQKSEDKQDVDQNLIPVSFVLLLPW